MDCEKGETAVSSIISSADLIKEVPIEIQQKVLPHLCAIYDEEPDQVGTGFLSLWNGKPTLITAKHTLFGENFDQDPMLKKVHLGNDLVALSEVAGSNLISNQDQDVAAIHVLGFPSDRCLPYTALQFDTPLPGVVSIVGFLLRDFRRSALSSEVKPKPFCYTNSQIELPGEFLGLKYTNRAINTVSGERELAPVPRGLSGTVMLNTAALLLGEIKVAGIFTEERLAKSYVFGSKIRNLQPLLDELISE